MKNLLLTWSDAAKGGHIRDPQWRDVEAMLGTTLNSQGVFGVEGETEDDLGRSIQVRVERGMYLLTYAFEAEGEWIVRVYRNGEDISNSVEILGDRWKNTLICRDPAIVALAFQQFFETGEVPDATLGG